LFGLDLSITASTIFRLWRRTALNLLNPVYSPTRASAVRRIRMRR